MLISVFILDDLILGFCCSSLTRETGEFELVLQVNQLTMWVSHPKNQSIFPNISKIYERCLLKPMSAYFEDGIQTIASQENCPLLGLGLVLGLGAIFLYGNCLRTFENIFSRFQYGFRKGLSVQFCLIPMTEKCKKSVHKGKTIASLLTDLCKAFDCLPHDFIIAKSKGRNPF